MTDASIGVPKADDAESASQTPPDPTKRVETAAPVTVWLPDGDEWEEVSLQAGENPLAVELPDGSTAAIVEVHDDE